MFDVLPPSEPDWSSRPKRRPNLSSAYQRRKTRRTRKSTQAVLSVPARDRTVRLDWKLPARLRKPVHEQLAEERRKKREREAILHFERKSIQTRPVLIAEKQDPSPMGGVTIPSRRIFNRGAEHHTGDVYRSSQPKLHMAMPPYMGSFAGSSYSQSKPTIQHPASRRVARRIPQMQKPVPKKAIPAYAKQVPAQPVRPHSPVPLTEERDIPYSFSLDKAGSVTQVPPLFVQVPKSTKPARNKFSLPFSFNFWPSFLWSRSTATDKLPVKKNFNAGPIKK